MVASQIWKYKLKHGHNEVEMPLGSVVLSAQIDEKDGKMCIWAIARMNNKLRVKRHFMVYGTGQNIMLGEKDVFVGTVQQNPFVWHIFEIVEE